MSLLLRTVTAPAAKGCSLFGDVFERVRMKYVNLVSDKALIENAIDGTQTSLDPHFGFMNAEGSREMQEDTAGKFGGLDMEVSQENGFIKVISPIDDTPASMAGIRAGDIITGLNGKTVQELSMGDVLEQTRGEPKSKVTLTIRRQGADKPLEITLRRAIFRAN